MVNVDIELEIYKDMKQVVKNNKLEYPSVKFFVQKALIEKLSNINE